ncbi:MAG: DUF2752 domain-containing protein [Leptolyngbyaceae cyanobacterium SL_5_9]|nr:DUF2752 domain-containing protein [Leptolyngbyaceae cyanobacterium SL_5_9]NJO74425.1 DUF2752 domain-containing protein [Leptolyngbyaceae cyanobacterium RM1_406_9]
MFEFSDSLSAGDRRLRWGFLGGSVAPVAGAFLYNQGYRLSLLKCPILHLTGIPCPTCGMTRSFMAIARGDFSLAIQHHLLGPIVFAGFVGVAIHIAVELFTARRVRAFYGAVVGDRRFLLLCLITALGYHAWRLYRLASSGELYTAFAQSPLAHLLGSAANLT